MEFIGPPTEREALAEFKSRMRRMQREAAPMSRVIDRQPKVLAVKRIDGRRVTLPVRLNRHGSAVHEHSHFPVFGQRVGFVMAVVKVCEDPLPFVMPYDA